MAETAGRNQGLGIRAGEIPLLHNRGQHQDKMALGWAKQKTLDAKTALDREKWTAVQRAVEDYDGLVQEVVNGNLDNIRTLEDIMTVTVNDGDKDVEYKPTIKIEGKNPLDPQRLLGNQQEKYVIIEYPKNAEKETKKIKIRNHEGSDSDKEFDFECYEK